MNSTKFPGVDPARSRLRATVAAVDNELRRELARRPTPITANDSTHDLVAAWAALVTQLALGPEPEVRECPYCHHIGMRAASQCGHCWKPLTPPT